MKKSVIFLLNGLGIERPGSYSISIDECMPHLSTLKQTAFFTTAVTNSLEAKGAYQQFFLGDPYKMELDYIKNKILDESLKTNQTYISFQNSINIPATKTHIFVEPRNEKVVEEINTFVNTLNLEKDEKIYMHLLLPQLDISEYPKLINIINYIKFHINEHITVGFVMGKNYIEDTSNKEKFLYLKKMLFYCSCERWVETDKKIKMLEEAGIIPCNVEGFTTTNDCTITNRDTILFFNTRREDYDNLITAILENSKEVFKEESELHFFSLIQLYTKYNIAYFNANINYENSLANILAKVNKKVLLICDEANIQQVNFYANGRNQVNNPNIAFMKQDNNMYNKEIVRGLIDNSPYDVIIFDYHMDVSKTINNLKEQLARLDIIIGYLDEICINKHSLFITSLYGLKKSLPLADYNTEQVVLDYQMQIPIFFIDYSYPHSKYMLLPGETNEILTTAIRCIAEDNSLYNLIQTKGILNNIFKAIKK